MNSQIENQIKSLFTWTDEKRSLTKELVQPIINQLLSSEILAPFRPNICFNIDENIEKFPICQLNRTGCECSDELCPHKSIISPFYLFVLNDYVGKELLSFEHTFYDAFDPTYYPMHIGVVGQNNFPTLIDEAYYRLSIETQYYANEFVDIPRTDILKDLFSIRINYLLF